MTKTPKAETAAEREVREGRERRIQALTETGNLRRHMADDQVAAELEAFGTGDQG